MYEIPAWSTAGLMLIEETEVFGETPASVPVYPP
jgi:hypothetical protein